MLSAVRGNANCALVFVTLLYWYMCNISQIILCNHVCNVTCAYVSVLGFFWREFLWAVLARHTSTNMLRANGPILLRQIMTGQETESEAVFFTIESIPYFKLSSFVSPNFDKPLLFPFDRGRTFVKGHFVVFRVWNSPKRSAFLKFPDPWPWINNRLDRWYGQVFRLYGWYFRSNGLARKRETTHYNAAELI